MKFVYESASGFMIDQPAEMDIDSALSEIDGVNNSFASLTTADGSYVQVGGGPTEFTVEFREVQSDGSFRHLKAGGTSHSPRNQYLNVAGAKISVRVDQVFRLPDVRRIFHSFMSERVPDPEVDWQDISSMFEA